MSSAGNTSTGYGNVNPDSTSQNEPEYGLAGNLSSLQPTFNNTPEYAYAENVEADELLKTVFNELTMLKNKHKRNNKKTNKNKNKNKNNHKNTQKINKLTLINNTDFPKSLITVYDNIKTYLTKKELLNNSTGSSDYNGHILKLSSEI